MIYGIDYLAGAKYGSTLLANHPSGFAAGFFSTTFGDAYSVIERLAKSSKCPGIRIHLLWSDTHTFTERDLHIAVKDARRYEKLRSYSAIQLSPYCEHNLSSIDRHLDAIKDAAPSCEVINTPWRGAFSKRYANEVHHGSAASPYQFSFDGVATVDADAEKFKSDHVHAELLMFWTYQLNLKYNEKDTTPRPARTVRPSAKLIKSLAALAGEKGECKLPKGWLYKSHAEQSDPQGDARSGKPLIIGPKQANTCELVKNGRVIETLKYYGKFADGRHRYYATSGRYGYEIAQEPVQLRCGGKVIGTVNPAFRQNEYRNS